MNTRKNATLGLVGLALVAGAAPASAGALFDGGELTGEISAGFDSRYYFRGLWFGDETAWTNISLSKQLSEKLTGSVNIFYTDVIDNTLSYSEANFGATLSYDAGYGTFDFGLLHYQFYDGFAGDSLPSSAGVAANRDASEANITYSQDFCSGWSGHATIAYDFRIDAGYAELGLAKSWALTDAIGMDFSVATGLSIDDYYSDDLAGDAANGFTHTLVSLAFPIQLTEASVFTPYVAANFSHEARDSVNAAADPGGDEVYFGASFAVRF